MKKKRAFYGMYTVIIFTLIIVAKIGFNNPSNLLIFIFSAVASVIVILIPIVLLIMKNASALMELELSSEILMKGHFDEKANK